MLGFEVLELIISPVAVHVHVHVDAVVFLPQFLDVAACVAQRTLVNINVDEDGRALNVCDQLRVLGPRLVCVEMDVDVNLTTIHPVNALLGKRKLAIINLKFDL